MPSFGSFCAVLFLWPQVLHELVSLHLGAGWKHHGDWVARLVPLLCVLGSLWRPDLAVRLDWLMLKPVAQLRDGLLDWGLFTFLNEHLIMKRMTDCTYLKNVFNYKEHI